MIDDDDVGKGAKPLRRLRGVAAVWVLGVVGLRATLWAPEVCPAITAGQAQAAAVAAADWIVDNQDADGSFLYEWDRATGEASDDYNLVRHAGVTMSLYQLVAAGEIRFLDAADDGLAWMLDRLAVAGDGRAFTDPGTIGTVGPPAKLGASSLLVVSLSLRRQATGDRRHDAVLSDLGRFIVGQQRPDGSMLNRFDLVDQHPIAEETSIYSTGEANWALALLHEVFPTERYDVAAYLTLDYVTTARDDIEGYEPAPWPDQWAAYTLSAMAPWGLGEHHVAYARELSQRYGFLLRFDAQRGTDVGSLTHGPRPRGAGFGTWVEAASALRLAALSDDRLADLVEPLGDTLACGAANLASTQVAPVGDVTPQEAGAFFTDDVTRMDDQQHAASGLLGAVAVLP